MRVISGSARGVKLTALPGEDVTRPTIDRVKEGMFSALQFVLPAAKVLDLFAGSGQLGIEALSRGAAHCTFVDQNRQAAAVVQRNCQAAGVAAKSQVLLTDSVRFLDTCTQQYHVVLLDPPYRKGILQEVLPKAASVTLPGGTVLCESEAGIELPQECEGLLLKKQYRYGTVLVTRYEKEQVSDEH
ncbi:16S rRNA (guanine(966)-N(2))-methyltransferase RsmD [uncultured Allofournierella sp.]|uniref:16S rRNA (guanine(966)-N(2))-methyltransferase RsmD n=1 Tax=uncultured Allofournierella sp. TaxID=1940258 RepID=UPI00375233D5